MSKPFPRPLPDTPAGRFELLADLYAPEVYDDDGNPTGHRDPSGGVITWEQFIALLDHVPQSFKVTL